MEELSDLAEYLQPPVLPLSIGGKKYRIESASGADWLRLQAFQASPESVEMPVTDLLKLSLGAAMDLMVKNGVSHTEIEHAGMTAYFWQLGRDDIAARHWKSGGKAPAAKKPQKATTPRMTRSAAASTTPRRASGTGGNSRRATTPRS